MELITLRRKAILEEILFNRNRSLVINIAVFIFGIVLGKFIFGTKNHEKENPTLLKFEGKEITINDVNKVLGEKPVNYGENIEYKKQVAKNIMKNEVIDDLAKKEGLSAQDYMLKIKKDADTTLTDQEINDFMAKIHMDRKKLTKQQFDNVIGNMKEQKRQVFFHAFIDKKISEMKVEQK